MIASSSSADAFLTCQACQLRPAEARDLFCLPCRSHIKKRLYGPAGGSLALRFIGMILLEAFFGIMAGLLVMIPISIASSSQSSSLTWLGAAVLQTIFIAPIIASLYTWTLRPWIARAAIWGWLNAARALILGLVTSLAVVNGLRLNTLPKPFLLLSVLVTEWLIGIGIARWQERYLRPPFQRRTLWRRWSMLGWTIGCLVHTAVALLITSDPLSLWLGTAAAFTTQGLIAFVVLARFAFEESVAKELQKEYQAVWFHQ